MVMSDIDSDSDVVPCVVDTEQVFDLPEELPLISSIWEDDHLHKISLDKPRWKCDWCQYTGSGFNASKALWHVTKVRGKDVKLCSRKIEPAYQQQFE